MSNVTDGKDTLERIERGDSGFLPGYLGNNAPITKIKKLEQSWYRG